MAIMERNLILFSLSCWLSFIRHSYSDTDTLVQGQQLKDSEHLISADGIFKLGFFSPGTSRNRYLGISYNIPDEKVKFFANRKVVWVANRNNPIADKSGVFMIDEFGRMKISHNRGSIAISPIQSAANNTSAILMDSGNFILKVLNLDGSTKQILWQSFDYPTDTLLPGMKIGVNVETRHYWLLTSWISENIPAEGSFSLTIGFGVNNSSQLVMWWRSSVYWTSGVWQNGHFELLPQLSNEAYKKFSYLTNGEGMYFTYSSVGKKQNLSRYMLDPTGAIAEITGLAPFGVCSHQNDPGCVQHKLPECRNQNELFEARKGFMSGQGFKIDESYNITLFDCEAKCLNNCSCAAYAFFSSDNQTDCEIWSRGMRFIENINEGRDIYVLQSRKANWWRWFIIAVAGLGVVFMFLFIYYFVRRKLKGGENEIEDGMLQCELEANTKTFSDYETENKLNTDERKRHELQFFRFESIVSATNNFANSNKLGEGGFGPVYKGGLPDGQEIAVKRLSRSSGQGVAEFRNELVLIAKLQHTNLVRLLGCCIQRKEKMLIYEYMTNKSLDLFLFGGPCEGKLLDWSTRLRIIEGIAQGLLYLHKYSRLRIIHRDLKASNILLDDEMNPKISDFGLARIFGKKESEANTKKIVGTLGYMSPEYALKGIVSVKVDVFSFGVLLLEIISGTKNNGCYRSEHPLNLIGYAWQLWNEDRALELLDSAFRESCPLYEVQRCIHVSLLCVQDHAMDRPEMENVVSMLTNETMPLPAPKQPAFFLDTAGAEAGTPVKNPENCSINNVSMSVLEAR